VFADHDVLLTPVIAQPPPPVEHWRRRGALSTFFLGSAPYVTYTAIWNYTGQPAASVPAGFDDKGLPLAVQLVGRPNDELTLISLAAQLEAHRPWAEHRPSLG
jgi:amidase